jgi:hypothetical protein
VSLNDKVALALAIVNFFLVLTFPFVLFGVMKIRWSKEKEELKKLLKESKHDDEHPLIKRVNELQTTKFGRDLSRTEIKQIKGTQVQAPMIRTAGEIFNKSKKRM